jgi:hypothetical protein
MNLLERIKALFRKSNQRLDTANVVHTFRAKLNPMPRTSQSLLQESSNIYIESVTSTFGGEENTLEWLMNNWFFREILFQKLYQSNSGIKWFTSLKEPFTKPNQKPGDIDLLLVDVENIDKSIAFECKVIKAQSLTYSSTKINKMESIKKSGVVQANKYLDIGFHKVYLMIIILDDGRNYKNPNILFKSAPNNNLDELYNGKWKNDLNEKIGIMHCRINQMMNNDIRTSNSISISVEENAIAIEQIKSITNKIKLLICNE